MKNKTFVIGATVLVVLLAFAIIGTVTNKPAPILLQGEVEATEVKVASKLVGRIESKFVQLGDKVKKGDQLLEIHTPEIDAKLQQAVAARSAAEAQNKKANNGARSEQIQGAKSLLDKATAGAELAEKTFARVENLYTEGVIPEQKRDEAATKLRAAQLNVTAAKSQYEMAKHGARYEDKLAAQALVSRADGAVNEVESYLSETTLTAPIDGEVNSIIAEKGELISSGYPVVTIVDLSDLWITFNVREDLLTKMKKGTKFKANFPALGDEPVELQVTYLKAQGSYATFRATKANGSFDRKTFEVRAVPTAKVKGLRPGMSAIVDWTNL